MNIIRDYEFEVYLVDRIALQEFKERTGVHLTDVCYCVNKQALRRLKPIPPKRFETLRFGRGWALQRWLTGKLQDVEEQEVDGIIVTLDDLYDDCPWELKDTDQSSSRPIEENIHWVRQVMGQCYARQKLVARLSRFENMGDWGWIFPRGATKEERADNKRISEHPTLSSFRLEFTQEELDRNWSWLLERRELFLIILNSQKLLPKALAIPSGQEWECGWCAYKGAGCNV